MNKPPFRFATLVAVVCFLAFGFNALAGSPKLQSALDSLKMAKKSPDPIPELQAATKSLKKATNNKGGKRDEVMGLIKEATELIKAGDRDGANQKIDHAVASLYAAITHRGSW